MTVTSAVYQKLINNFDARHKVILENIANANTPMYKSKDVPDFSSLIKLKRKTIDLKTTSDMHIKSSTKLSKRLNLRPSDEVDLKPNGNNVSLVHESNKLSENSVLRSGALASFKSLNKMLLAACGDD